MAYALCNAALNAVQPRRGSIATRQNTLQSDAIQGVWHTPLQLLQNHNHALSPKFPENYIWCRKNYIGRRKNYVWCKSNYIRPFFALFKSLKDNDLQVYLRILAIFVFQRFIISLGFCAIPCWLSLSPRRAKRRAALCCGGANFLSTSPPRRTWATRECRT